MADLTLTSASVQKSAAAVTLAGTAGATFLAGQTAYRDNADLDSSGLGKWKPYDCNAVTPADILAGVQGVFDNSGAAGQSCTIIVSDPVYTHGFAGVTKGDVLVASATAGGIAPVADLATGWRPAVLMIATSATQAVLRIAQSTTAK